jgi:lysophospholipase L1-like esterase
MRILAFLLLLLAPGSALADDSLPGLAGGETGDRLVFVGDSLTLGVGTSNPRRNMPSDVSALFGDGGRRFKVIGIQGAMAPMMRDAFMRETLEPTDVVIIWLGRIGVSNPTTVPSIKEITEHVPSGKYLVLSVIHRVDFEFELPGTRAYDAVTELNAELSRTFAGRFVTVGEDVGRGNHSDELHLNDSGYAKIAKTVFAEIGARGW